MKFAFAFFASVLIFLPAELRAQEPFNVPSIDNRRTMRTLNPLGVQQNILNSDVDDPAENFQFLSEANLQFSTDGKTHFLPNVAVNVAQYRLSLFSHIAKSQTKRHHKGDTVRVNLPLLFITKFGTDYSDSSNADRVSDLTSFIGSPLTVRAMPMYSLKVGLENTFTIGMVHDLRTIVLRDSLTNNLQVDFGYYGSVGIQYSGKGDFRDPETAQETRGNWSVSLLAYTFICNPNIQSRLFEDQSKNVSGLEGVFKFTIPQASGLSRYNLFASFQYNFNKPVGMGPYVFKIGFGN